MSGQHFLTSIFKPGNFSAEDLDMILSKFKQVSFSKSDYLLREGKIENIYWLMESGYVRSYVIDTEGNDISTNFYATGNIVIDWTSFFLRDPTRENFQALTDCVCWQLDFDTFQQLFHGIKNFREQGRTNLVSSYFALRKQSISMIADQAKDRYITLLKEKPYVIQQVPLKHIASYLGITDTSLSRIRKEIAEEKNRI